MRYDDLIYNPINEAQLTPGQVKAIKIKINDYEKELRDLRRKKDELDDKFVYSNVPKAVKDKVDAYVAAYTREIEKLKSQLQQQSANPKFDNFIAGIKKNCSEIVKTYQQVHRFFYAGFANAKDQTALYGKPKDKLNMDDYHGAGNGGEVQKLIETFYPDLTFESAVYASSDVYEISHGKTAYIIFPKNGFKFFYPYETTNLRISPSSVYRLFDRGLLKAAHNDIINDKQMFVKFKAAGGDIPYPQSEYVGESDGFMGRYTWENNVSTIEAMVNNGELSKVWRHFTKWSGWASRQSLDSYYGIKSNDIHIPLNYGHDCIISTSGLYAINYDYRKQVERALGI